MQLERIVQREHRRLRHRPLIEAAGYAACGLDMPLPLVRADGTLLGLVRGRPQLDAVDFVPAHASAPNSYDQLIANLTADPPRRFTYVYEKSISANPRVDTWNDLWSLTGDPTQGTYTGAANTARQFDESTVGALVHGGNVAPLEKYLLSCMPWSSTAQRMWLLYDRVLSYEACTMSAVNQAMVNVLTAQRYAADGQPGLRMFLAGQSAHNATAADLTVLSYVNNAGGASVVPTVPALSKIVSTLAPSALNPAPIFVPSNGAAAAASRQPFLPLAVGDTGVRAISDYTWSAAPTGTFTAVLAYPIALVTDGAAVLFRQILDTVNSIGGPPRLYDGACLAMLYFSATTTQHRIYAFGDVGWIS